MAYLGQQRARGRDVLGARIPATETARRLRQLLAERFTKAQLARALGLKLPVLHFHLRPGDGITLRNALKVKRLRR